MGKVTSAACKSCGYFKYVRIGGSKASWTKHSSWPVYCDDCQTMTSTNLQSTPLACQDCDSVSVTKYDEHHLVIGGASWLFSWFSDKISDGLYFCPQCEKHELAFNRYSHSIFD